MSVTLRFNTHGKSKVRVVKVTRKPDGTHLVQQINVQLLLEGDDMDDVFITGTNVPVIPTDTCKNTVYCLAKMHDFDSIEEFGCIICRHFLTDYPQLVNKISVEISEDNWERLTTLKDSKGRVAPHKHTFRRLGPQKFQTFVTGEKRVNTPLTLSITSGFVGLEVLKTTQSGFEDFHRDRYTSLPDVADRCVATSVTARWVFNSAAIARGGLRFKEIGKSVEAVMISEFAGPSDVGIYSPSVQLTLYEMAKAAVLKESSLDSVTLEMPNIHNIPFPLETYGFSNKDHTGYPTIFYPTDEPHGLIKATVERSGLKTAAAARGGAQRSKL